jgi:hypothetical protein
VTLIVVPEAACDPENCFDRNSTNEQRKDQKKFEAAFGTIFKICKCVQRSRNFILIFLLNKAG